MQRKHPVVPLWSGRVPKWKIARLYENDAKGLHDEELIDDVAYTILLRCESMLSVGAAHDGRATCPVCKRIVERSGDRKAVMGCEGCGWTGQWEAYLRSYKGKHLTPGGLEPFCQQYIDRFPTAKTPQEKMLLIDWIIHRFHYEGQAGLLGRPGAVNLIGGTANDVNAFLEALTIGKQNDPRLVQSHQLWRDVWQRNSAEWKGRYQVKRQRAAEVNRRREIKRQLREKVRRGLQSRGEA